MTQREYPKKDEDRSQSAYERQKDIEAEGQRAAGPTPEEHGRGLPGVAPPTYHNMVTPLDGDGEVHMGLPVHGYRPQNPVAVEMVNQHKQMEEELLRRCDYLLTLPDIDMRWLAIGRTHIEQAFMAINRAVFKPERVTLEDDHG